MRIFQPVFSIINGIYDLYQVIITLIKKEMAEVHL